MLTTAEFVEGNLRGKGAGKGLSVTDQTSGRQTEVVADAEQLLNALVGHEVTHGRTVVGANDGPTIEGDAHGAGPGLENAFMLALNHGCSPPRPRMKDGCVRRTA